MNILKEKICKAWYGIREVNKGRRGGRELEKGRKGELHYLMNETVKVKKELGFTTAGRAKTGSRPMFGLTL
jgi:hypothetical protein